MNAVTKHEAGQVVTETPPVSVSETTAIVQMIERAASNPAVDIDKMERLLEMQERVMARRAKAAYTAALSEMQPKLPVIAERGGIKTTGGSVQSTYALWEDINEAIRPFLAEHGFALSFRTGRNESGVTVTGVLSHRDGHSEETTLALPIDSSGSKNAVQSIGSSTSYGKRYTAQALLNLTSRGEDDDGKAAGAKGARDASPAVQAATSAINALNTLDEMKAWKAKNAGTLQSLPSADADAVVRHFNDRFERMKNAKGDPVT